MHQWTDVQLPEPGLVQHFLLIRVWRIRGLGIRHSQHFQRYRSGHGRRSGKRFGYFCLLPSGWPPGIGFPEAQYGSVL